MRIAMLSPLEMRVPPPGYGGTEVVVSLLTEELVRRGHDVTLFASGDSETHAQLVPGCEHFLRGTDRNKGILTVLSVMSCLERAGEFDIIHNHTTLEGAGGCRARLHADALDASRRARWGLAAALRALPRLVQHDQPVREGSAAR